MKKFNQLAKKQNIKKKFFSSIKIKRAIKFPKRLFFFFFFFLPKIGLALKGLIKDFVLLLQGQTCSLYITFYSLWNDLPATLCEVENSPEVLGQKDEAATPFDTCQWVWQALLVIPYHSWVVLCWCVSSFDYSLTPFHFYPFALTLY